LFAIAVNPDCALPCFVTSAAFNSALAFASVAACACLVNSLYFSISTLVGCNA